MASHGESQEHEELPGQSPALPGELQLFPTLPSSGGDAVPLNQHFSKCQWQLESKLQS